VPPDGNFAMEVRYAIDDRHRKGSLPPYAPAAPQSLRAKPSDAARSRQKWARSTARAVDGTTGATPQGAQPGP